jgi:hypothetical protein
MAEVNTDLTVKPMQTGSSLADMVNMAKGIQSYQQQQQLNPLQLRQQQLATKLAEEQNPETIAQAKLTTQKQGLELKDKTAQIAFDEINGLAANPYIKNFDPKNSKQAVGAILNAKQRAIARGVDPAVAELLSAPLYTKIASGQGGSIHQDLIDSINASRNAGQFGQATSVTPVSTGQRTEFVQTSPFSKAQTTQSVQGEVPITQEVIDPETGAKRIVGVQPKNAPTNYQTSFSPTQVAQNEIAAKEQMTNQAEYKNANTTIATLKNIKALAPGAFTGVGSEYKKLAAGILTSLGIDSNAIEQSKTEEISKNAALLTLAGGNTDLARQIAESATPNSKMSERTIKNITNQLIGVQRMNQARLEYVQPYISNTKEYNKHLNIFDKYKDYRLFQLADMTPAERKEFKASLPKEQFDELTQKIKDAESVGIDLPTGK